MAKVDETPAADVIVVTDEAIEGVEVKRGHPILKGFGLLMLLGAIAAAAAAILQRGRSDEDWNAV